MALLKSRLLGIVSMLRLLKGPDSLLMLGDDFRVFLGALLVPCLEQLNLSLCILLESLQLCDFVRLPFTALVVIGLLTFGGTFSLVHYVELHKAQLEAARGFPGHPGKTA